MGGVAAAAYVDRAARRGGQDTTPPRPHPAAAAKPRKHPAEGRVRVSERERERERERESEKVSFVPFPPARAFSFSSSFFVAGFLQRQMLHPWRKRKKLSSL